MSEMLGASLLVLLFYDRFSPCVWLVKLWLQIPEKKLKNIFMNAYAQLSIHCQKKNFHSVFLDVEDTAKIESSSQFFT